jgi:hypothetical protein
MRESFQRAQDFFRRKDVDGIEVHRASEADQSEDWPVLQDHPELIEVLGPEPSPEAMRYIEKFLYFAERSKTDSKASRILTLIISELANRKVADTLPVPKEEKDEFLYRRHVELALERKAKTAEFIGLSADGKMTPEKYEELSEQMLIYFGIELKKALWTTEEFYPKYFEHAVAQARGDVMQFLVAQANADEAGLDEIRKITDADIQLKDPLLFYIDNARLEEEAGGVYKGNGQIEIKIPTYFDQRDEWSVYAVAVHELIHSISSGRMEGHIFHDGRIEEGSTEMLEAVTELVTYAIVQQHLASGKQGLSGLTVQRADVRRSGYADYVEEVRGTLGKIPLQLYVDAMITVDGMGALIDAFNKEYGKGYFLEIGRKLKELREFRGGQEEGDEELPDNVVKVDFGK